MPSQYHPNRYPQLAKLTTRDTSVSDRLKVLYDVTEKWARGGSAIYDLADAADSAADFEDLTIAEIGSEQTSFYVHAGQDAVLSVGSPCVASVDGVYFIKQDYQGRSGYFFTIVTAPKKDHDETAEDVARIACGWIDADLTVDEGLINLGLWGDPSIINDPNVFDIECFVGYAFKKVSRMVVTPAAVGSHASFH
jgi:hypothetical protein